MKFVISGYFGFQNLGDEAILAAMIDHLEEATGGSKIVVLSKDPVLTGESHNVLAINRGNIRGISKELRDADLFISGGGGLLQDVTSSRSVPYYLGLVVLAKAMKIPVFFYAQGIGPLNLGFSKFLLKTVGNFVDTITVRDEPSLALLKSLGVTKPKIHVAADPAFALKPDPGERNAEDLLSSLKIPIQSGPLIIVSVRPWRTVPGFIPAIAKACDDLVKTEDAVIVYVPFHKTQDIFVCQACIELMQEHAFIMDAQVSPGEIMSIIKAADFLIGMRYHSLVFSVATATPFVALSYDPKVDGLLSRIGEEPALCEDNPETDMFSGYVKDTWLRRKDMKKNLSLLAPKLAESAKHVAYLAADVVKEKSRS